LSQFEVLCRDVERLQQLNRPPGLAVAYANSEQMYTALRREKSFSAMADLAQLEAVRPVDAEARHTMRCKVLALLREERVAAGIAILASFEELSVLGNPIKVEGETVSLESVTDANELLKLVEPNVRTLLSSLDDHELRLHSCKYGRGASFVELESLVFQIACKEEQLAKLVDDKLLSKTTASVIAAERFVLTAHVVRAEGLKSRVGQLTEYFGILDEKQTQLEKATSCFDQIGPLLATVDRLFKDLQEKKEDVPYIVRGVSKGEKAAVELDRAKQMMIDARLAYNEAVGRLLEIRLSGYPELRCAAA
jgi:hypothetical protein